MDLFTDLGQAIDRRWRRHQRDPEALPALAREALLGADLPARVAPLAPALHAVQAATLPRQHQLQAMFGQPPLTVFMGEGFFIEVLYWVDGTTLIHQHAFSGAFQVLHGESLHVDYAHTLQRRINPRLRLGRLDLRQAQLLRPGDVREIWNGERFIHANFHLERPTVTVVVRTSLDTEAPPQHNYSRAGLSWDPFSALPTRTRAMQLLGMICKVDPAQAEQVASDLIRSGDLELAWWTLELARRDLRPRERYLALLALARETLGEVVDAFVDSLRAQHREELLLARRAALHDPAHRYVLALLLNIPGRDAILQLMAARFPGQDPLPLLARLLGEMSATRTPTGERALGVDLDETALDVFQLLVTHRDPDAVLHGLAETYDDVSGQETQVRALCDAFCASPYFHGLFADAP